MYLLYSQLFSLVFRHVNRKFLANADDVSAYVVPFLELANAHAETHGYGARHIARLHHVGVLHRASWHHMLVGAGVVRWRNLRFGVEVDAVLVGVNAVLQVYELTHAAHG